MERSQPSIHATKLWITAEGGGRAKYNIAGWCSLGDLFKKLRETRHTYRSGRRIRRRRRHDIIEGILRKIERAFSRSPYWKGVPKVTSTAFSIRRNHVRVHISFATGEYTATYAKSFEAALLAVRQVVKMIATNVYSIVPPPPPPAEELRIPGNNEHMIRTSALGRGEEEEEEKEDDEEIPRGSSAIILEGIGGKNVSQI
jgi:hypothetical protein